jgi:hypothetical protein
MRLRGSRYDGVKTFAPGDAPGAPFPGLRARDIGPATGLLEHVVGAGERLDLLALQFYNDDRLWWRILDANPGLTLEPGLSLASLEGRVLIIPRGRE